MSNQKTYRKLNRRDFLKVGGMGTVALTLGTRGLISLGSNRAFAAPKKESHSLFSGYGPLVRDPGGVLDLPHHLRRRRETFRRPPDPRFV